MIEQIFLAVTVLTTGIEIHFQAPDTITDKSQYRWTNVVLEDPAGAPKDCIGNKPQVPYYDPPIGGWGYECDKGFVGDNSKYYWDDADHVGGRSRHRVNHYNNWRKNTFVFKDHPQDFRLKPSERIKFRTCLVDTFNNDRELKCINWSTDVNQHVIAEITK